VELSGGMDVSGEELIIGRGGNCPPRREAVFLVLFDCDQKLNKKQVSLELKLGKNIA
jgi:hypothetical protein